MAGVMTAVARDASLPLEQHVLRCSAALDVHGHLVVLVPPDASDPARRRLHTVRSVLAADRMALIPVGLPPLATALLAEQLRQLSATDLGPGVLAGAAPLLAHYFYAGALLGSVARLDRVNVSVGSHLKSLIPGRQFAVAATPEPRVVEATERDVLPGPAYPTHLTVAASGSFDTSWIHGPLARAWRPQHVRDVAAPEDCAHWWGTSRVAEFTAHIADPGVLYQLVTSVRRTSCRWCALEIIGDRCLFCSTRVENQAVRPDVRTDEPMDRRR
ncbi:hypothetical protein NGB36_16955 [Streptomyces sp. RB6PN25]|uniref:Uncharacterized protein n=1 Tax=Streptomyces humicola TaxID=2953240 RepID=A0ABT1Q0D9_9ACTN|nr:hypothetical protein [Streptomyces humicola]MCQ4082250.1 hypothetical protein [Streptomyces humicola]